MQQGRTRTKRTRRNSDRCKIRIQTQTIELFDYCLLLLLSRFVRYGNVQYGYGKVCFDDGRRNNSCSILVSRRQRAVYVDIGFCVGQIRAQNNYNCDVLFGVGVLFAVYFKRYVQVDSVFDRLCNRRIYGQLLGRGRYYRRNNVLRVFSYKLAFVRNCNQHVA